MRQNAQTVAATVVGAVLGGLAGYLFFTDQGRAWRRQMEPHLEDLVRELSQFRGTVARASDVASEGWRVVTQTSRRVS